MTPSEKATVAVNNAAKLLVHPTQNAPVDEQPTTHQISGCHWDKAINSINLAMMELLKARKELEGLQKPEGITPTQSGTSQVACDIINNTFLSLDGFEALRNQMDAPGSSYSSKAFASQLARIVDRELNMNMLRAVAEHYNLDTKILMMTDHELAC